MEDTEIKELIANAKKEGVKEFLDSPEFAQRFQPRDETSLEFEELSKTVKGFTKALKRIGKQVEKVSKKVNPDSDWECGIED